MVKQLTMLAMWAAVLPIAIAAAEPAWPEATLASGRGRTAVDHVKKAIAPFWKVK